VKPNNILKFSDLWKSTFPNQSIQSILNTCLIKDRFYLKKAIYRFKTQKMLKNAQAWANLTEKIQKSQQTVKSNLASVPQSIVYDDTLPIAEKREDLIELIKQHQVVVIAGETGSGKTTQIPKMCLDAGQGVFGRIACTQPRRLAARSVAERIAEELGSSLGQLVGYQVRFHDQVHQNSLIKVMTDGILLAEIQNDRFLNQYDTIIIDEAHERSINIDFLLGILKQLLPKRPDLKVIITSATIDTQRFSDHFGGAPVREVSGRTYPVEVRYQPLTQFTDDEGNEFEQDIPTGIIHAIESLEKEDPFGDILVFQVGEREIKETEEALRKHQLKNTLVVPLYAKLSMAEQNKVFQTSQKRRIILATNVAETSLTVPGIKFVIDPGLTRISRYSVRTKVQRLPIEKISQASANQRKGRCGRVSSGICVRLYDEEDFNSRPEFTDPEIHRTSLATVILQMAQLKLGEVSAFPFIEPPEPKNINDGFRQLQEIGALDEKRQMTLVGQQIAKLPLDPRIAKMVLEAQKNGVLHEVLVIASAISIQDPRIENEANRQQAKQAHKVFLDTRSDFLFYLNLWRFYEAKRRHLSQNKLRKLCKTNLLSYPRMKEWHDLYSQLEGSLKRIGTKISPLHLYEEVTQEGKVFERLSDIHSLGVHKALMAGLLGNIALRDENNLYLGARGTQLQIHPSSVLYKRKPKWLVSAELVETAKLYARTNAAIDIRWVESLAGHLIKKSYTDPHWQKKAGQVGAYESVTLYGLPIITRRRCNYGPVNPKESRKIFIQSGLINGELNSKIAFYQHNLKMMAQIQEIETKLRRPDYMVDDAVLYDFYDACLPMHIYSQPAFEKWAKKADKETLNKCKLTEDLLLKQGVDEQSLQDFPNQIQLINQIPLSLDYHFEPGKQQDGIVFNIPLSALNLVKITDFEWLTPGFLKEKVMAYIKALPKHLRKQFVPVPQYADLALQEMSVEQVAQKGHFLEQLVWALNRRATQRVQASDFDQIILPSHLMPYFKLQDERGKTLAESDDLEALKKDYTHLVEAKITRHQKQKANEKVVLQWDFGDLAQSKTIHHQGADIKVFPALQIKGHQIVLGLLGDEQLAQAKHGEAVLSLLRQQAGDKERYLQKKLSLQKACLCYAPYGTCQDLTQQVIDRALRQLITTPEQIKTQQAFENALEILRHQWIETAQIIAQQTQAILVAHQNIAKKIKGKMNPRWLASMSDLKTQLDGLISKDFVRNTPEKWFKQCPRYLQGLEKRLEKIDIDPIKDQQGIRQITPILNQFKDLFAQQTPQNKDQLIEIRWQIEELRLSIFSQPMKTLNPVSIKRIEKMLKAC